MGNATAYGDRSVAEGIDGWCEEVRSKSEMRVCWELVRDGVR